MGIWRAAVEQVQPGFNRAGAGASRLRPALKRHGEEFGILVQNRQNRKKGRVSAALMALALLLPAPTMAQPKPREQVQPRAFNQRPAERRPGRALPPPSDANPTRAFDVLSPWSRMNTAPAAPMPDTQELVRPEPPSSGRSTCVRVDRIAGAQLFGDAAIELTMNNGKHWRMFLADECPGLSFYQGFYYRRGKAGMLCAGRDSIGARSGGECPIASIVPVQPED